MLDKLNVNAIDEKNSLVPATENLHFNKLKKQGIPKKAQFELCQKTFGCIFSRHATEQMRRHSRSVINPINRKKGNFQSLK